MARKSPTTISVADRLNFYVELAEARLRSVRPGSALDSLIRPMVNELKNSAVHAKASSEAPLLLQMFSYYDPENKDEVARLDAIFDSLWLHAKATNRETGVTRLSQQLLEKSNARAVVSAIAEATALGLLVQHWGKAVDLWPLVRTDPKKSSDCLIRLPDVTINVEVGAAWTKKDTRSGRPYGRDDIAWRRLQGTLTEKRPQFRKDYFNLLVWSPFISQDERYGGFDSSHGNRRFESELSCLLRRPTWDGLQLQVAEMHYHTGWLRRIYVCRKPGDSGGMHERVKDEVREAFDRFWFVHPEFEIRSVTI